MKLREAAWLALSATMAGCFGTCAGAELAEPGVLCRTRADCLPEACQLADCIDGICTYQAREPGTKCGDGGTNFCNAVLQCVTCRVDEAQNDNESDVDCGGNCPACPNGKVCAMDTDCQNDVCDKNRCRPAACTDGKKNNPETDIDCGGTCLGCADGKMCMVDADCEHKHCSGGICCGVPCKGICSTCATATGACELVPDGDNPGNKCTGAVDACDGAGHCKSCTNGHVDPGETDVDCGGPICPPCAFDGGVPRHCNTGTDCATCACDGAGLCAPPTCADGKLNGCETDVDCGGPWCGHTCGYNQNCKVKGDCLSKTCENGKCGAP